MRKTRKVRHQPETEGIYLDELIDSKAMDPELAALYFPKRYHLKNVISLCSPSLWVF